MLPAILIIASVFAYLLGRLASAHFKHKLGPQASDDGADSDSRTMALASELESFNHDGANSHERA